MRLSISRGFSTPLAIQVDVGVGNISNRIVAIKGIVSLSLSISLGLSLSLSIGISTPLAIDNAMAIVATVPGWVVAIESVVCLSVSLGLSLRFRFSIGAPLAIDVRIAQVAVAQAIAITIKPMSLRLRLGLRGGQSRSKQREENLKESHWSHWSN